MSTQPAAPQAAQTLEQRIDAAIAEAGQIAGGFSPAIGALIEAGVSVEPVISALFQGIAALFHKRVTATPKAA